MHQKAKSDDARKVAEHSLERLCIENSLVLVGEISKWRKEMPSHSFSEMCAMRHTSINEGSWLDVISAAQGAGMPVPSCRNVKICDPLKNGGQYERFFKEHSFAILQDDPVIVAATINPFAKDLIESILASECPGKLHVIVLISPHLFAVIGGMIERGEAGFDGEWGESLDEWGVLCGFDPSTFLDTKSLIEELWMKGEDNSEIPVIFPGQFDIAEHIPGLDAVIVMKSPLHVWAATPRPLSSDLRDALMQRTGLSAILVAVGPNEFRRLLSLGVGKANKHSFLMDTPLHVSDWRHADGKDLYSKILEAAIEMHASDIHMEPKEDKVRIRFRIDGLLRQQSPITNTAYHEVIRRLKLQGKMMQDVQGRFQDGAGWFAVNGARYDLRMSVSVLDGGEEACVVRIFNSNIPSLSDLRLPSMETKVIRWFLGQGQGMLIASGPTGSGKTTLLYALMRALNLPEKDLVSIEQPVEKHFSDVKQITVFESGNITFESALRTILRQDPDIIMVGEIRDKESCKIAVQAAQTGHLVLTTLHANEATGVVQRMVDAFEVDRISVAHAIKLAIAQRLVPRLCPICRRIRDPKPQDIEHFPSVAVAKPIIGERNGCSACRGTGIQGRHLVMELLPFDDVVREMISGGRRPDEIATYNSRRGYRSLLDQATELLLTGEIELATAAQFITRPLV